MQDIQHIIQTPKDLLSVQVTFGMTDTLSLTSDPKTILFQMIIKLLMTTPGTDSFFPTAGAGFQKIIAKIPKGPADAAALEVQVATGVIDVDRQIRSYQSQETTIPKSGRLKKLRMSRNHKIAIIEEEATMIVPLDVITYDGVTTQVSAPFSATGAN